MIGSTIRKLWHDRNPVSKLFTYGAAALAPHASVQRFTYTVGASKKAMLECANLEMIRLTASGTPAIAQVRLIITPSGGAGAEVLDATIYDGVAFSSRLVITGQFGVLYAGDQIEAYTNDASTGGTFYMRAAIKVTEFDA